MFENPSKLTSTTIDDLKNVNFDLAENSWIRSIECDSSQLRFGACQNWQSKSCWVVSERPIEFRFFIEKLNGYW